MSSINKVMLIGRLGKDPEIRHTQNGKAIANFSLATSEKWKDQSGQQQERTEWHRVVVFGNLAGIVERYIKKGSQIYVEGKMQTRKWTDQQGVEKYSTEVVLDGFSSKLTMLGGQNNSGGSQEQYNQDAAATQAPQQNTASWPAQAADAPFNDEIPF